MTKLQYAQQEKEAKAFSRIDGMLVHKTSLNKLEKIEIVQNIFFFIYCYLCLQHLAFLGGLSSKY